MDKNSMIEDSGSLPEEHDTIPSCPSLADVIGWSKNGYVIVLNAGKFCKCYCRPEYFSSNKMIQIDCSKGWKCSKEWKCLMEWPWFLLDSGCVRMLRDDFLKLKITNTKVFSL